MSSPRWLIGFLTAFVLLTMIGNIVEYADVMTSAQVSDLQAMQGINLVESKEAQSGVGGSITYATFPLNMIEAIWKAITMDFSFLYDVDPVTGENTPNSYYIVWAIIWWPVQIGLVFSLAVLILSLRPSS